MRGGRGRRASKRVDRLTAKRVSRLMATIAQKHLAAGKRTKSPRRRTKTLQSRRQEPPLPRALSFPPPLSQVCPTARPRAPQRIRRGKTSRRALSFPPPLSQVCPTALWVYPQFRPHSDSGQIHSDSDQIPYRILIRMVFCTEIKSPALGMAPECRCAAPPRLCSPRASAQTLRGGQGGAGAQGSSAWALARGDQSSGTAIRHSDGLSDQNLNASLNGF